MCIPNTLVKIQTGLVCNVGSVNLVIFTFLIGQQGLGTGLHFPLAGEFLKRKSPRKCHPL
jgi:hypothetical protein